MQRAKFILLTVVLLGAFFCGSLTLVEKILSARLIPQNFEYLEIQSEGSPAYGLKSSFQSKTYTVRDNRREESKRGTRPYRMAFLGDSVTFGLGVKDGDNFVERLQKQQSDYDAYNYGVPGYGIDDILAQASALNPLEFRRVVYTLNPNDLYSARPGLLTLLEEPELFARTHGYAGWEKSAKLFLKEHFRTFFVLSQWWKAFRSEEPPTPRPAGAEAPLTEADVIQMAEREDFKKYAALTRQFWGDPQEVQRLAHALSALRQNIHRRGSELLVAVFYDYAFLHDDRLHQEIVSLLAHTRITHLDTFALHQTHYRETGFFADPSHLGPQGHAYFADALQNALTSAAQHRLASRR